MKYRIILADGTSLDNLTREDGCYISSRSVSDDTFKDNTSTVTIVPLDAEDEAQTYANLEAFGVEKADTRKWRFALRGRTAADDASDQLDDVITALMELAEIVGGIDG